MLSVREIDAALAYASANTIGRNTGVIDALLDQRLDAMGCGDVEALA